MVLIAISALEPAFVEMFPVALNVVNAPVLGVVPPIAPGAGKLVTFALPSKLLPPIVRTVAKVSAVADAGDMYEKSMVLLCSCDPKFLVTSTSMNRFDVLAELAPLRGDDQG